MVPMMAAVLIGLGAVVLGLFLVDEARRRRAAEPKGMINSYWTGVERRRMVRLATQIIARYHLLPQKRHPRSGELRNLSASGLQIVLEEKLQPGARMELEIQIEDQPKLLVVQGQVVWSSELTEGRPSGTRQFATGIQFINLSPSAEQNLMGYIEKRLVETPQAA